MPEMVVLQAGEFQMGSGDQEAERSDFEGPQHAVKIRGPLAVGKYEVTFAEWDACVADGGCSDRPRDLGGAAIGGPSLMSRGTTR